MEDKIVLALIASLTALLVSIVNLIGTLVITQKSHRQSQAMERIKSQTSLVDEETRHSIAALNEGIGAIQKLKDAISVAVQAVPSSVDHRELVESLTEAVRGVVSSFEIADAYLTTEQRRGFHAAKNLALRIREIVPAISDISSMSAETRSVMIEIKRELTGLQTELRGLKVETLVDFARAR